MQKHSCEKEMVNHCGVRMEWRSGWMMSALEHTHTHTHTRLRAQCNLVEAKNILRWMIAVWPDYVRPSHFCVMNYLTGSECNYFNGNKYWQIGWNGFFCAAKVPKGNIIDGDWNSSAIIGMGFVPVLCRVSDRLEQTTCFLLFSPVNKKFVQRIELPD